VCVGGPEKDVIKSQIQRVFLLKLKNANGLLKGREPSKEFVGCPVIGVDAASITDSHGN
jgi:hypothetical protein